MFQYFLIDEKENEPHYDANDFHKMWPNFILVILISLILIKTE